MEYFGRKSSQKYMLTTLLNFVPPARSVNLCKFCPTHIANSFDSNPPRLEKNGIQFSVTLFQSKKENTSEYSNQC